MNNFILVTDGRELAEVERRIRKYLPGVDVRLFPIARHQAILRGPILQALRTEYVTPLPQWQAVLGIGTLKPVSDQESAVLLARRDAIDLPARAAPAGVAADWHLQAVRAPGAWALLGGPEAIDWGAVKVGHVDTGYTRHPAFGFPDAPWLDVAHGQTFFAPHDAVNPDPFPVAEPGGGQDAGSEVGISGGHGTRIGGTICGHDPAAPTLPFHGVAPRVPLVPVRITDSVWINHAQREFAQAVDHLLAQQVSVINVSLGVFFGTMTKPLRRAVNEAYEAGVPMVCAAGNYVNAVVGPAKLARTVAVAGVTRADVPWSGSSYGPEVDFSAPAADLRRANVKGTTKFSYAAGGDGTSYATAITTGAAALWLRHRGAALDAAYTRPWQRIEAFRHLARATARVPALWQPQPFGTGILDVEALLRAPLPDADLLQQAAAA